MGDPNERDKWGNKIDFILSCLGYAVGLGNVWRFPYLCGRSGGAAFLIPYFIMMIFAGFPVFYMELALGQFSGLTPHLLYRRMCPLLTGIGYTMITISVITGVYYNMIIAWSMFYFGVSFTSVLPWDKCNSDWGTNLCFDDRKAAECEKAGLVYFEQGCKNFTGNISGANYVADFWNKATVKEIVSTPAGEYLKIRVLKDSGSIAELGTPSWELVLALFFAWVLVFFCLIKGIKSSGKVVYFTATFPYVVLLILMIRGLTLDGAYEGIKFFIMDPNMTKLAEAKTWGDAAQQIFFSLSLGGGGLTTLASYNEFNNNLLRDTLIVVLGNCATSIFAGFAIFPVIGFMSKNLGKPVSKIAAEGTTLAFQAYPDALTRLPGAPVWAILFFFMLVILGIDSQLVIVEVVITCIVDQFPSLRVWKKKICVVLTVCSLSFLLGIILTCPGGSHVLDLLDTYAGGWTLVMACFAEVCMVSYIYGIKRFIKDIRLMMGLPPNFAWKLLGYPVNPYWWINWFFITPVMLFIILLFNWIFYKLPEERWTGGLGWAISMACFLWIPLMALGFTVYFVVSKKKPWRWLITPAPEWGPNDEAARQTIANEQGMKPFATPGASAAVYPGRDPPPKEYYKS